MIKKIVKKTPVGVLIVAHGVATLEVRGFQGGRIEDVSATARASPLFRLIQNIIPPLHLQAQVAEYVAPSLHDGRNEASVLALSASGLLVLPLTPASTTLCSTPVDDLIPLVVEAHGVVLAQALTDRLYALVASARSQLDLLLPSTLDPPAGPPAGPPTTPAHAIAHALPFIGRARACIPVTSTSDSSSDSSQSLPLAISTSSSYSSFSKSSPWFEVEEATAWFPEDTDPGVPRAATASGTETRVLTAAGDDPMRSPAGRICCDGHMAILVLVAGDGALAEVTASSLVSFAEREGEGWGTLSASGSRTSLLSGLMDVLSDLFDGTGFPLVLGVALVTRFWVVSALHTTPSLPLTLAMIAPGPQGGVHALPASSTSLSFEITHLSLPDVPFTAILSNTTPDHIQSPLPAHTLSQCLLPPHPHHQLGNTDT